MPYTTIDSPNKHFDTTTYTANGGSQTITNSGSMQPDFFWGKTRSTTSNHILINSIVGVSKYLYSNTTASEVTDANYFTSFNSNGFSVGSNNYSNGTTMVAWQWKGGGTGVSNTSGTISSTVSANTTSGFSIVSWAGNQTAGASCGHGLGVAPSMIIKRRRNGDGADYWYVYHKSLGNSNSVYLNDTSGSAGSGAWNSQTPTSTVFYHGSSIRENGNNMIAYCFAEVKGFSKAFSYTGNGSSDGVFVNLGFKPAFIMIKASSTTGNWFMQDITRNNNFNGDPKTLQANNTSSESTIGTWGIDLLSNGFKVRESNVGVNGSGSTYIGIAFASNPFVSSKGIPTCAV